MERAFRAAWHPAIVIAWGLLISESAASIESTPPAVTSTMAESFDSHFSTTRVTATNVSWNGRWVAFATQRIRPTESPAIRSLEIVSSEAPNRRQRLEIGHGEKGDGYSEMPVFAWANRAERLAFQVQTDNAESKIALYDAKTARQVEFQSPVFAQFIAWSPDDRQLVLVGNAASQASAKAIEKPAKLDGFVIRAEKVSFWNAIRPAGEIADNSMPMGTAYLLDTATGRSTVIDPGAHWSIHEAAWSPDGRTLALIGTQHRVGTTGTWTLGASLLIYRVADRTVSLLRKGVQSERYDEILEYTSLAWSPDGKTLALLRRNYSERFTLSPRLEWVSMDDPERVRIVDFGDVELYGYEVTWNPGGLFLENTLHARHSLFRLNEKGGLEDCFADQEHGFSAFSSTRAGARLIYVKESFFEPPEMFQAVLAAGRVVNERSIVRLNAGIPRRQHTFARVNWKSGDGAIVYGWLLKPAASRGKPPLLTYVHGGPIYAPSIKYMPVLDEWPYPVEAYLDQGYVVFIPNYHMTGSYGKRYQLRQAGRDVDQRAADDIASGVRWLRAQGIVDHTQLGLMGHSYGFELAALAAARLDHVTALAIADGTGDKHFTYFLNPVGGARDINEFFWGNDRSPMQDPNAYNISNPATVAMGFTFPTLIENGEHSSGGGIVVSKPMAQALARYGKPYDWIVYPRTGHNVTLGILQKRIAERNLDWFNFWMLSEEDSAPEKAEQYGRWRALRAP